MISLNELSERIANWEKFINSFPDFIGKDEAKSNYNNLCNTMPFFTHNCLGTVSVLYCLKIIAI
jgi:hypothetical protein